MPITHGEQRQTRTRSSHSPNRTSTKAETILDRTNGGLDWLKRYYDRPFRRNGKGYRSKDGKIAIQPGEALGHAAWYGTDFTGAYESGNLFSIYARENRLTTAEAITRLFSDLGLINGNDLPTLPQIERRKPAAPRHPWEPNRDRNQHPEPSVAYRYEIDPAPVQAYPKPISPETLARYGVQRLRWIEHAQYGNRTYATKADPLYLFTAGENTKIYRPAGFNGKGKQRPGTTAGHYVFGFDQLPGSCQHILIAAGQNDTLALNDCLNHRGIYAVCLWSESSPKYLHPDLLSALQRRCEGSVWIAYDDDDTGNRTARQIEETTGAVALQIPHAFGVNDICDALEGATRQQVAEEFARQIERSQAAANDPFFFPLEGPTLEFSGYIGKDAAVCKALTAHVEANPRSIIQAPTGAGKTTWIMRQLAPAIAAPGHPLVIAVPTQALADQVAAKHGCPRIRQGKTFQDIEAAKAAPVVVCTYDSAPALRTQIEAGTLVVDESHHVAGDCTFKPKQIEGFEALVLSAPRCIQLSATPSPYWQRNGFRAITLRQADTKPIKVHPVRYEKTALPALMERLSAPQATDTLQVVFWNDKAKLEAIKRQLVKMGTYQPEQVALLRADDKDDNPAYQSIIEAEALPPSTRLVLTTQLIADGVNVNGLDRATVHAVNIRNEEIFVQFPARFRQADVTVLAYAKAPKTDAEQPNRTSTPPRTEKALDIATQAAEAEAARANVYLRIAADQPEGPYKPRGQDWLHLVRDTGAEFVPFYSAIYATEIQRRDFGSDLADMLQRVAAKYPHFQIENAPPVEALGTVDPAIIEAEGKRDKQAQKSAVAQAYRLATHAPDVFCLATYQAGDAYTRREIEHVVPRHPDAATVEAAANMQAENPEVFERRAWERPARQIGKLCALHPEATAGDVVHVLTDEGNRSKKGFSELVNRLEAQRYLHARTADLDPKAAVRRDYLQAIRNELAPYVCEGATTLADVPVRHRLTPEKLRKAISRHTGKDVGQQAARIARELFHVGQGKGPGGKQRYYYLSGFLTLAEAEAASGKPGSAPEVDKIKQGEPNTTPLILSTAPDFVDKFDPTESTPF